MSARPFVVVCSWCGLVKQVDGAFAASMLPPDALVSHGMCPDCFDRFEMPVLDVPVQAPLDEDTYSDYLAWVFHA